MTGYRDAEYRLEVAQGFLGEARQDVQLGRWRSAVDNAQLTVENATKAVLALAGPVGRTIPRSHSGKRWRTERLPYSIIGRCNACSSWPS